MAVTYSIIIPHYNIPDLLMRCLSSIPVRPDVQVIVIDDCSPDAATYRQRYPQLSRQYLELYSTTQSGSAGRARNVGLDHATGRWLIFADADDFFADSLSEVLDRYAHDDSDLIYFGSRKVMSDDISKPSQRSHWLDDVWSDYERDHDITSLCGRHSVVWGKFFSRDVALRHGIRFDETRYSNDFYFAASMACNSPRVKMDRQILYFVTERAGSLANSMHCKEGELAERAAVCFRVEQQLLSHGIYTKPFEPFNVYMSLLYRRDRQLYYHYFRLMPTIGYPRRLALRQFCHGQSLWQTLKVYVLSFLSLI